MHRLSAARLRGDETIAVQYFDGSEQDAYLIAVRTNIAHGLPLSLADRTSAAERIIEMHPAWSDRAIAATAGLGARTVGNIRRRLNGDSEGEVRIGRDGRVRPVDNEAGRRRALELINQRPGASLREIAREVGVSPSTVRDVRLRLERGEEPVGRAPRRSPAQPAPERAPRTRTDATELAKLLEGLQADPSLRFTESGRALLRWIFSRAIRSPDECLDVTDKVPSHCTYIIAGIARRCANEWEQLADALDQRTTETA
jgi:transposase-like protein